MLISIKNTELGNCAQFIFAYESLHGIVTYKDLYYNPSATGVDGWRGQWIKLNKIISDILITK